MRAEFEINRFSYLDGGYIVSEPKGRKKADVVKLNSHTTLVRLPSGKIIKRHDVKHNVKIVT